MTEPGYRSDDDSNDAVEVAGEEKGGVESQRHTNNFIFSHLRPNPRLQVDIESDSDSDPESGSEGEEEKEEYDDVELPSQPSRDEENNGTEEELNKLTVIKLKERFRQLELPVSGRKNELIDRLMGRGKTTGNVKEWRKSKAKSFLVKLIEDENSKVHKMTAEEIYKSHDWFQNYSFAKFKTYLRTIQAADVYLKNVVDDDEREIWSELIAFPRGEMTVRGYPFWHIHAARDLLEKDVRCGNADEIKPKELWEARVEYQAFPELVFCHHVHQEKRQQREEPGWVDKRNKKARKMHEDEVMSNKESWDVQHTNTIQRVM